MGDPTSLNPSRAEGAVAGDALRLASGIVILSFVLAMLYLGRDVLEPLVIAGLLSLVLAPAVRRLRRWHAGRVTSVLLVVTFALASMAALGFLMEAEVGNLAGSLPRYQSNLSAKIKALQGAMEPSGVLRQASETLRNLEADLKSQRKEGAAAMQPDGAARSTPVPVEVQTPQPPTFEYLKSIIGPLVTPFAMAALVILFLVFILLYREDLRDRVLRLAGTRDLQRSTAAMDDAGYRLSRYFLLQSAINASMGVVIGCGLWLIGVPNPALWGMLTAVLRFVPLIGIVIAAVFPLVLAASVDPAWTMMLLTAALFIIAELIAGQAVEPVMQGQHTGLSPVAIVIATLFWTLIWGVAGLLLAVPVTVCIAVLGRHVEALSFIGVLLGDEPALEPHERFYQRVLAGDAAEASDQAEEQLATEPLSTYYDAVPMRALTLAQADAAQGKLLASQQLEFRDTIEEIVDDLSDYSDDAPKAAKDPDRLPAAWKVPYPVLLFPARSPLDEAALLLLAHVLEGRGLKAWVQPLSPDTLLRRTRLSALDAPIVCVSYFGVGHNPAHVRYAIRRLRRMMPKACFIACFWLLEADSAKLEEWRNKVGAECAAASLREAASLCIDEARAAEEANEPSSSPEGQRHNILLDERQGALGALREIAPLGTLA